jgi:hypothetical protein
VVEGSRPTLPGNEVVFISAWPSRAAFDRHLDGQVFSSWTAKYLDLFLTDDRGGLFVTSEFLDQQAGFVRPVTTGAQPK